VDKQSPKIAKILDKDGRSRSLRTAANMAFSHVS